MADKEERIIIAVAEPSLLECGADKIYTCMTKQEAIKRMAKRLEYEGVNKFECHTIAKWCLDELLKGVKNETH